MILKYLIEKEFKQTMRNPILPRLIVIFPCIMLLLMPWAANLEIRNINISVVDNDHSPLSERLVEKIAASDYFRLVDITPTYNRALETLEQGRADLILEIPPRFETDLMRGENPQVLVAANSVNGTKGALGSSYASSIVADYSAELQEQYGGIFAGPALQAARPQVMTRMQFNPHMNYKLFMVPALMVMLLTMLCGFLPALNIVSEKETGTIEQINVTPVRKSTFILGKLIPYWIIGFIVLNISILVAWLFYGFTPAGSIFTIYLFALIFVVVMTGIGLVISNNSGTMQQAMFVMFFFVIVFILMSGLFTPIQSMPGWAKAITVVNPLRYFIEVMRSVYLKGSVLSDLYPQLFALLGFATGLNAWAILSYRKKA